MAVFLLFCVLAVIQTHGFQAPIFFYKKTKPNILIFVIFYQQIYAESKRWFFWQPV